MLSAKLPNGGLSRSRTLQLHGPQAGPWPMIWCLTKIHIPYHTPYHTIPYHTTYHREHTDTVVRYRIEIPYRGDTIIIDDQQVSRLVICCQHPERCTQFIDLLEASNMDFAINLAMALLRSSWANPQG